MKNKTKQLIPAKYNKKGKLISPSKIIYHDEPLSAYRIKLETFRSYLYDKYQKFSINALKKAEDRIKERILLKDFMNNKVFELK